METEGFLNDERVTDSNLNNFQGFSVSGSKKMDKRKPNTSGILNKVIEIASNSEHSEFDFAISPEDYQVIIVSSNEKSFLHNDILLFKNLKASKFGKLGIIDTRKKCV